MKQLTTRLLDRAKQMVYDRDREGFTLIELIVVMAIISILVLLAAPQFLGYTKDAEVTAMQQDIKVLSDAALQAHIKTGHWPVNEVSHRLTMDEETLELKGLDEEALNQYVKSIRRDLEDYAIYTGSGAHKGDVFFVGNDGNGLTDRDGKVFFGNETKQMTVTPGKTNTDEVGPKVTSASKDLTEVNGVVFYGEVSAESFITGDELASRLNFDAGTAQHSAEPWLKFAIDGKTILRPKRPIRYGLSWDQLNNAGLVDGDTTITIDDVTYKVRLMKGLRDEVTGKNPTYISSLSDRGARGSEWNRLMLPIHEESLNNSWANPQYVDNNNITPIKHGLGTGSESMYTDKDLLTHYTHGNGSYVWMQETSGDSSSRVVRGYFGVSRSHWGTSSATYTHRGWVPVLEVVE